MMSVSSLVLLCLFLTTASGAEEETKAPQPSEDLHRLYALVNQLSERVQMMEAQLNSMNEKIDSKKNHAKIAGPQTAPVMNHPSEGIQHSVKTDLASSDPEAGFSNDESVQAFRKAMILFQGQKYPESILAFSQFLENSADHPLAGSAQYYIGKSYLLQKEYRLALQEYQRVLTSYDRSTHIADTLNEMALAEESLKISADAQKHRQLLSSLFPEAPIDIPSTGISATPSMEVPPTAPLESTKNTPPETQSENQNESP